ncbi:MAG: hypothetical protein P1P77_02645 [Spirochaetaceae bacterium]|nr:hypothetical protein [Spirochaetaceae bacterium]
MNDSSNWDRPEEVIAEVYRQVKAVRETGREPERIVMSRLEWSMVEDYRRQLGVIQGPVPDYLSEDSLFGLEIWYGDGPGIIVT